MLSFMFHFLFLIHIIGFFFGNGSVIKVVYANAFSASSSSITPPVTTTTTSNSGGSIWKNVPMGPPDVILGIAAAYRADTSPNKVNICVGAYRNEEGLPWILPSVQRAEEIILQQQIQNPTFINKEYLPIEGDTTFVQLGIDFAYGMNRDSSTSSSNRPIVGVQTLSGTGACRIGGEYLKKFYSHISNTIYIPDPTWMNHYKIFQECNLNTIPYRYYNKDTNQLDFHGMIEDLQNAPNGSIFLFHACAHNPTGCDPTNEQWETILQIVKEKELYIFFDSAYQGFASGNSELDAYSIRLFYENKIPMMLAQSFAKNFGLYGERCGILSIVCDTLNEGNNVLSQLKNIIRPMYSSPPKHGSTIIKTILQSNELKEQYYQECTEMSYRIQKMRQLLIETLYEVGSQHNWEHISSKYQIGMFAYTGMKPTMVQELTSKYHIYLTLDGRISLAGLNEQNIHYVANAIHEVTKDDPTLFTTTTTTTE